jgi:hypothetical protein
MGVRGLSLEGGRRGQERTEFENTGAAMVFANADDLLVHIPPIGVSNVVAVMVEQAQNGATNGLCQPPRRDSTTALPGR